MILFKLYDAAGPTPSFLGKTTAPEVDDVSETRIVETATFLDGIFEGKTLRYDFIGRFDFDRSIAEVDELRILVDGERHQQMKFDRPLDVFERNFNWALDAAAERGVHFTGNLYANYFSGDDGNDRLMGGGGDDRLWGAGGVDVLRGGDGADRLLDGWGVDRLIGGPGDDLLDGGAHNDVLDGGDGDDRLKGGEGDDVLRGGDGADRITDADGWGVDRLVGGRGDDRLSGFYGEDALRGEGGDDRLEGGWDADRLVGGRGDDRLIGGAGADELTGGGGADVFVLYQDNWFTQDRVTDFRPGRDVIDLSRFDARAELEGDQSFRFIGEEEFSGRTGELRFDGQRLVGVVYEDSGSLDFAEIDGVETLNEADLLL